MNLLAINHFQGRILGITIGCLIGMTPLLFMDLDKKKKDDEGEAEGATGEEAAATASLVVN